MSYVDAQLRISKFECWVLLIVMILGVQFVHNVDVS